MKKHRWTYYLFWAVLFGISLGYFEAAVVVDLRAILCTDGALFPLQLESGAIGRVELGREFFALVMLVAVAALLARNVATGIAWFCLLFGVWDIFYYVFLKVILNWPASLWTMDILFLLPVPWVGPVLAPIIASVTLIGLAIATIRIHERGGRLRRPFMLLAGEVVGSLVMITAFCRQWRFILAGGVPHTFPWALFAVSETIILYVFHVFALPRRN